MTHWAYGWLRQQAVKAPEIVRDRQDLHSRETSLPGISAQDVWSHGGARPERRRVAPADRQAMQNAPAVHKSLELIPRGDERLGDFFVGHQHRAARREQGA